MRNLLENLMGLELDSELSEGLAVVKKNLVDTGKIPRDVFDKLSDIDPTKNKKYVEWLAKMYLQKEPLRSLEIVKEFDDLLNKNKIPRDKRDINQFKSVEQVVDLLQEIGALETGTTKKVGSGEIERVYEDDKVMINKILSKKASCKYGKGTKWCIAGERYNRWTAYVADNLFYFIEEKGGNPRTDLTAKIAVQVDDRTGKRTYWDAEDTGHDDDWFLTVVRKKGWNIPS